MIRAILFTVCLGLALPAYASEKAAKASLERYFRALKNADYALLQKSASRDYVQSMDPRPVFEQKMKDLATTSILDGFDLGRVEGTKILRAEVTLREKDRKTGAIRTTKQWYQLVPGKGGEFLVDRVLDQ